MFKKLCIIASFPVFLIAARFIPFDRLPSTCVFFRFTGLPCPACGMTRSVMAITRLDFMLALQMNPLGIVFVGIFGLCWVISIYQIAAGRRTRLYDWAVRKSNLLALLGVVILILFGVFRIIWFIRT